jgi:hypothetical protein
MIKAIFTSLGRYITETNYPKTGTNILIDYQLKVN